MESIEKKKKKKKEREQNEGVVRARIPDCRVGSFASENAHEQLSPSLCEKHDRRRC